MIDPVEVCTLRDNVFWQLCDWTGRVKAVGSTHNLVTQQGDTVIGERAAGIGVLAAPTGIKLGTGGGTAPAKTGTGAAMVSGYIAGSNIGFDGGYPASALSGSSRQIMYRTTYAAGVATSATAITEACLVNLITTDSTALTLNTIARAVISPGAKGALDSLVLTWLVNVLGA